MAKPESSPLVQAALAFDEQLATYARLGELFVKAPLDSMKHVERANATLSELATCEERLQATGKALIDALTEARRHQEELSARVVAQAPALQARNQRLGELMDAMNALARDVAAVNAQVLAQAGGSGEPGADPATVSAAVLGVSGRAQELAGAAHAADFEELASQAHALHQRLLAIATKLQKAAGN